MPEHLELSVEALVKLKPQDLRGVVYITQADPDKWTQEHLDILKDLVRRRANEHHLDTTVLDQKLTQALSGLDTRRFRSRSPSRSPSPQTLSVTTFDLEATPSPPRTKERAAIRAELLKEAEEDHRELIELGGRPAYPPDIWWAPRTRRREYAKIMKYWSRIWTGTEIEKWLRFRELQKEHRADMETFTQFRKDVFEYRRKAGLQGDINLLFDHKKQTKVDEWKEYQYFMHRELPRIKEEAKESRLKREQEKKEWEAVHGTGHHFDPNDGIAWIYRNECEVRVDDFMVLLEWIEDQIPKIEEEEEEEEEAIRAKEASAASPNNAKSNQRSSDRKKSSPVLGVVGGPRVTKARKKAKSGLRVVRFDLPSATLPGARTTRISREVGSLPPKGSTTSSNPVPLRRSQRIHELEQRKAHQAQTQENTKLVTPKRQPRNCPKGQKSKRDQGQKTRAKQRGVTKRQTTKKTDVSKSTRPRTRTSTRTSK